MSEDFVQYGPEWRAKVKKLDKDIIVDLLAKVGKERDYYKWRYEMFETIAEWMPKAKKEM